MLQGGWLLLLGNLLALWVTVGFLAGWTARSAREAMLSGAGAEAAAAVGFYVVKYLTDGVPWAVGGAYLLGGLLTGLVFGWLAFMSARGHRLGVMVLAATWIVEPLGWVALDDFRAGHANADPTRLVVASGELLVGLLLAVSATKGLPGRRT